MPPYENMTIQEAIQLLVEQRNGVYSYETEAIQAARKIVKNYARPGTIEWIQTIDGTWLIGINNTIH